MAENAQQGRPWFFNLRADGDSAIVRVLHSTVDTIEKVKSHRVEVDGKKKRVRCLENDCPLCNSGNNSEERIYIHLYDYTDNMEKVWERTDKLIPQLVTLQNSWNPLNSAVIKITRKGNEFPKYDIEVQNPMNFQQVANDLVDTQVAKMFSMKRTADEVKAFIETGAFPERKAYVTKEEYLKQKAAEKATNESSNEATEDIRPAANTMPFNNEPFSSEPIDDPFMDSIVSKPRKV